MLEETGTVIKVQGEWLWLETQPRSACSHCGTGSCSTSVIAKLFGARPNRFRLRNSLRASPGQEVLIGIPGRVLVAVSVQAYLLPLVVMLLVVAAAGSWNMGEGAQAMLGLGGLFAGMWLAGVLRSRKPHSLQLLRIVDPIRTDVILTELRSRS